MNKRIAMYWHNGKALGHTSRSATLGKALLDKGAIVVGITGASRGLDLIPKEMDILKIPSYLGYDGEAGVATFPIMHIGKSEFQHIRENLIFTFARDFNPDIFIADYSPQGKKGELIPALIHMKETRKILGFRGVLSTIEEAYEFFFNPDMASFIKRNYSAIHVYTDPNVFSLENYYKVPPFLLDMIKYTGYVSRNTLFSKQDARAVLGIGPDARVIVANFGGGQGSERIWTPLLSGLINLEGSFDNAYLASGPYIEDDSYNRIKLLVAGKNKFSWTRFLDPLHIWMKASDLFIGSGGYNTLAEIISLDANALVIPRQIFEKEQAIHCSILADLKIIRVLPFEDLQSGTDLEKIITTSFSEPLKHNGSIRTDGALENARLLLED